MLNTQDIISNALAEAKDGGLVKEGSSVIAVYGDKPGAGTGSTNTLHIFSV